MIFGILLTSFQRITFLNVPAPFWILLFGIVANLIMLVMWVYFQALLHIYRFHGFTRVGFSLKVCLIFFSCVIFIFISAIVPYLNLNRRIYKTFIEPDLPSRHASFLNSYNDFTADTVTTTIDTSEFYVDTAQSVDAFKYEKLYFMQKRFDSLPETVKENITVALMGSKLEYFENLELNKESEDPYLTYEFYNEVNQDSYLNLDTLKIFYTTPLQYDSIRSEKFDRTVWIKKFRGQVNDGRDTVISRYYFYSMVEGKNLIGTADIVQDMLLEDQIIVTVNKAYPELQHDERSNISRRLYNRYYDARASLQVSPGAVVRLLHIAIMLTFIIVLMHAVVHLFGISVLFLGLILPVLLFGVLIGFTYLKSGGMVNLTTFYTMLGIVTLVGLFIGVIKLPFAKNPLFRLTGLLEKT